MEEKQNLRKAMLFVLFSLIVILLLVFFGLPLITKTVSFFTGLHSNSPDTKNLTVPPAPPLFEIIPDAVNKSPLTVNGHVESGDTVVLNLNGKENELLTESDGKFSSQLSLNKGSNTLFAYAKNPSGIISKTTNIFNIIYDNDPPIIDLTSPADGSSFYGSKQQNVNIKGLTEVDATLTINDRIVSVGNDGSFSYNFALNDGENILYIRSLDKAGNEKTASLKLNFLP